LVFESLSKEIASTSINKPQPQAATKGSRTQRKNIEFLIRVYKIAEYLGGTQIIEDHERHYNYERKQRDLK
jgi:hypothetical protein